jgi:Uma2 family endonuclease
MVESGGAAFAPGLDRRPSPEGAIAVVWGRRSRWQTLTAEEPEEFPPLCRDFIVVLRSRSDDLATLPAKMQEYVANGT